MKGYPWQKTTPDERLPLTKDHPWWKATTDKRPPLMKGYHWQKTTPDERLPLTKDHPWWKATTDKRPSLMKGYHWQKTTPAEKQRSAHPHETTDNPSYKYKAFSFWRLSLPMFSGWIFMKGLEEGFQCAQMLPRMRFGSASYIHSYRNLLRRRSWT